MHLSPCPLGFGLEPAKRASVSRETLDYNEASSLMSKEIQQVIAVAVPS